MPTFRVLFNGPSGSGKSNLAKNLIVREYSKIMHNIFMFCPTIDTDRTLCDMVNDDEPDKSPLNPHHVVRSRDVVEINNIIEALWDTIEKRVRDDPYYKSLFVFDDLSIEMGASRGIMNLFTKGRKINASIFLMSNKYRTFNPTIRNNLTHMFIFRPSAGMEADSIIDDIRGSYSRDDMRKMFVAVFQKPFDYLYVNRTVSDNQFRKGLSRVIRVE